MNRFGLFAALLLSGCSRTTPQPEETGALRLVSTAPNLTECVFAVGAGGVLVGRTEFCNYPPEVRQIPVVGGFANPYLEPLLAVRPTQVIETVLADPDINRRLEDLKIATVHVPCARLDEVPEALLQIGALTGHVSQADRLAATLRAGIAAARAQVVAQTRHPRVLLLLAADAPITAGSRTFISELLELAGGRTIDTDASTTYYRFSLEWLLTQNPDIILCLFATTVDKPYALFDKQTGWNALDAVRRHRVYGVPNLDVVCRPGPRLLEGFAELKRILDRDAHEQSPQPPKP